MYIVNGKESVVHCVGMVYTSTTVEPCDGEKEYIVVKHRQTKTNLVGHIWMTNRGKHFCRTLLGDVVVKWAGWTCWKTSVRNSLNIFSETLLANFGGTSLDILVGHYYKHSCGIVVLDTLGETFLWDKFLTCSGTILTDVLWIYIAEEIHIVRKCTTCRLAFWRVTFISMLPVQGRLRP